MSPFAESVRSILPECLLIAVASLQFLIGPFLVAEGKAASRTIGRNWAMVSLAALVAALWLWYQFPSQESSIISRGLFRGDSLAEFVRGVAILAGIVFVLINWGQVLDDFAAEFHGLLLLMVAGVSLTAAANDLIVLFLALELVSIPTYVFLYLPRREAGGPEATTKYFLLSVFSSAIVLYGFSFLYWAVGTTHLGTIHQALVQAPADRTPAILLIAAACIVAGLSFRVTAVPFHFYAPDVFQGSHAGACALLSFVPKIAGFVALLRILHSGKTGRSGRDQR
jgi:NADH-quinone oxidoreductase subunit N